MSITCSDPLCTLVVSTSRLVATPFTEPTLKNDTDLTVPLLADVGMVVGC